MLVAGRLVALPVPVLLMWRPAWGWIVFANVLPGINQDADVLALHPLISLRST
ncbi:hypothetical protein [Streptomyces sp. NPDC001530]|uniref:hypothetical protein n=1 Tax=Streptomyces sp. NPDC001530 TaxID=3364582 RepID=UPI0036C06F49